MAAARPGGGWGQSEGWARSGVAGRDAGPGLLTPQSCHHASTPLPCVPGCGHPGWRRRADEPKAAPGASAPDPQAREPLFDGLGPRSRQVATASADAQRYFDQGLKFLYAFNHDEAIRSFRQAATLDPTCAMAWWGVAYACGPHINNPTVDEPHAHEGSEALAKAREHAPGRVPSSAR